ncbi:MAG TPA: hypothetical protein DHW39_00385 [Erysipelotrichaceae bacterium]|nr:hypothetical protein [Erysipelotrichaceae bacterium]
MRIVFVMGPVFSGKSIYIKKQFPDARVVKMKVYDEFISSASDNDMMYELTENAHYYCREALVNTVRAAGEDETVVLEHPMLKRDARDFFLNAVREVTDRPVECVVLKTDPEEVKEIADHQPAFIRLHDSEIGVMDIPGEDEGFCSVTIVTNVLK